MNFKIEKPENVLVRMILDKIQSIDWHDLKLIVSFKGRKIKDTFGVGYEAREFKIVENDNQKAVYLSPRDQKQVEHEKLCEMLKVNRLKGGEANKKRWAYKKMKEARLKKIA